MNIDQPLFWHQGLFLQPQHLQHTDRLNAYRATRLNTLTTPHGWGVASLQINEAALAAAQFVPMQVSVVFRDGTLVEYPGNALLGARNFTPADIVDKPRIVYLGLRRYVKGGNNLSIHDTTDIAALATTRFVALSDQETMPDLLTGEHEAGVKGMYFLLRLFWEDDLKNAADYDVVALAQIRHDGDAVCLAPHYVPPSLNLSAPSLSRLLRNIRDDLVGRALQLGVHKQLADPSSNVDVRQIRSLYALAILNRYGALLTHMLDVHQIHPWHVYGVLCQIVGELSWFSMRCDMLGRTPDGNVLVPSYKHENIGGNVLVLSELITEMLNEIAINNEQLVRFELVDGYWSAIIPEALIGVRSRFYLVIRGDADPTALGTAFALSGKLCASSMISTLIAHSLPGVYLTALPAPPAGLPQHTNAVFFMVDTTCEAWSFVIKERCLSLFYPNSTEGWVVELIAIRS